MRSKRLWISIITSYIILLVSTVVSYIPGLEPQFTYKGDTADDDITYLDTSGVDMKTWMDQIDPADVYLMSSSGMVRMPRSYDLRKWGHILKAQDQGSFSTCWAFAATTALESSMDKDSTIRFSPDHMAHFNPISPSLYEGGEYTMAMAYYAGWYGPVAEEEDPYGDGYSPEGLSPVVHVQDMRIIKDRDEGSIKTRLIEHMAVQSTMYTDLKGSGSESGYYDKETTSYCYDGDEKPNHNVVIIGYDDDYPSTYFGGRAKNDGAWIVQSSWGEDFGDEGVFYVSYEDTTIATNNVFYYPPETADNYDEIYQSDKYGWIGQIGYGQGTNYMASVYTAKSDEELAAVGFYIVDDDMNYEIYVCTDVPDDMDDGLDMIQVGPARYQDGTIDYDSVYEEGYYTIKIDKPISLHEGQKFAVIVALHSFEEKHPIAIEYAGDSGQIDFDITDGEGYICRDGLAWQSAEKDYNCNLCLKAYTRR